VAGESALIAALRMPARASDAGQVHGSTPEAFAKLLHYGAKGVAVLRSAMQKQHAGPLAGTVLQQLDVEAINAQQLPRMVR